jgi:hypothetical protein
LFKVVYGDGPIKAVAEVAYLQKNIKFQNADKIGKSYNFPVILSNEAGVTYLAAGAGVSTLNAAVAATVKEAVVDANQIIIRGQMDYEAAAKAVKSKEAFQSASELLVENLMDTGSRRLEMAMLYGRSATGLGTASSSTNVSTTVTNLNISALTWSPGVWAGSENAVINLYTVAGNTLVSSGTNADFVITSVDYANLKVKVTGTTTGITALDTALAAPCYIHWKGARAIEPIGIDAIIANTGTLFGIDASVYGLWAGSTYSAASATLTIAKILNAVSAAVSKGGLMEEVDVLMSPKTFTNITGTMTDIRRQNGGIKETTGIGGFENLVLMGPNGKLNVVPHPMIKEGEAFIVPLKRFKRIGSQEFSFETPGRSGELFLHVPDANAYELRLYGAQAIVCVTPAKCVKITNIVNT